MEVKGPRPAVFDAAVVRKPLKEVEGVDRPRVGAWEWNTLTNVSTWTPRVAEILGVSPDSCPPELDSVLPQIHADDRARVHDLICRAVETGTGFDIRYRIVSRNSSIRCIESRADVFPDGQGRAARYVGTITDVTADEANVESHRKRARQMSDLIELLPAAIYVTDADGRIILFNHAAAELWGRRPALGSMWCGSWRLFWPDGSPMRHDDCPMAVALREDRCVRGGEAVAEQPDGTRVPFISFPTPLHDTSGELVGAVNLLVDIAERKELEVERAKYVHEVETLNTCLKRAMVETHHRVRNNLQVISAMIEMMATNARDSIPAQHVRALSTHIRALSIVHGLLTLEAKKGGEAERVCSREILSNLLPLLEHPASGCEIRYEIEEIALSVRAATGLALITNELVQNAVKFGRRHVHVQFNVEGERAHLCVRDDGPGFPKDFDPESQESTGIELVRSLSRWDLAGKIEFTHAPGGGALVHVDFPLRPACL